MSQPEPDRPIQNRWESLDLSNKVETISKQQQKEQPRRSENQKGKCVAKHRNSTKPSMPTSVQPVQNTKPKHRNSPNLQQLTSHRNQKISLIILWTKQSRIDCSVDFKGLQLMALLPFKSCHNGCCSSNSCLFGALHRCRQME